MMRWSLMLALKDAVVAWILLPIGIVFTSLLFAILGLMRITSSIQYLVSTFFLAIYCIAMIYLRFNIRNLMPTKDIEQLGGQDLLLKLQPSFHREPAVERANSSTKYILKGSVILITTIFLITLVSYIHHFTNVSVLKIILIIPIGFILVLMFGLYLIR